MKCLEAPNSSKDTLFGIYPKFYLDYFHNSDLIHNFGIITKENYVIRTN